MNKPIIIEIRRIPRFLNHKISLFLQFHPQTSSRGFPDLGGRALYATGHYFMNGRVWYRVVGQTFYKPIG